MDQQRTPQAVAPAEDEDILRIREKYKRQRFERNRKKHQRKQALALLVVLLLLAAIILGITSLLSHRRSAAASEEIPAETVEAGEALAASAEPAAPAASEAPAPVEEIPATSVTLMAVGDNLMHNTVMECGHMADGSYDFTHLYEAMADDIQAADIACINQETIYIDDPSEYTNYPAFGGPTAIGEALAFLGFDVVTHATNHAYDKLDTGILDTVAFWRTHPEVTYLGIHDSAEDAAEIRVVERNGIRIAMLNYAYGLNYSYPSEDYLVDLLWDEDKIADDIQRAQDQSDIVLVFLHDGTEYTYTPDEDQLKWAQFFADHGVGAVIGSHPHVVQPMDTVVGKDGNEMPVFYSLGNFISHQDEAPRLLGAMANMTIVKDSDGTRVTDCTLTPLVTLITRGADHGAYGLNFSVMRLDDYTDDMAAQHIIAGTSPAEFRALFDAILDGTAA
jgi:poly-gamma-glutamate synthesis protein (capsule biosynthesis protein)